MVDPLDSRSVQKCKTVLNEEEFENSEFSSHLKEVRYRKSHNLRKSMYEIKCEVEKMFDISTKIAGT